MCGIAGIIGKYQKFDFSTMLKSQHHRGPDAKRVFKDENYAIFGHNRLAIIDLSSNANQPFLDPTGRYLIVFNGEIYNYLELKSELIIDYEFITKSDTEVLLAVFLKYGAACLNKLNGMFSFAIWDIKEKKLFAARDRFGVKPFYYSNLSDTFMFSSEIKAIHKSGVEKKPNREAWLNYFYSGSYGMPNETFWEFIYQLPGGHYLEYTQNTLTITKWYDFVNAVHNQPKIKDYECAKTAYKALLEDSIKLRFRADVPIGINVSGGLDSSALIALVNNYNHNTNIETFTFYTGNADYDELPWVEQMLQHYQNPLHKMLLLSKEVPLLSKTISNYQDEPYGGLPTLAYSKLFKEASKKGIKVLLDGQGMDEQLAGYDYYTSSSQATIQGVTKSPFRTNIISSDFNDVVVKHQYPKPFSTEIENLQYRDLFYTKIPRALRFNDRISMAYSTELRDPFLDFRLVELGFSLPIEFKIKNQQNKIILRDVVSEYLPKSVSYAPKRALQTPQREWLAEDLKGFVEGQISKIKYSNYKSWFNIVEINREWDAYLKGNNESSFHIWQLLNFSLIMNDD
ncbi:MAG: asparagine synthase (glutamine-hydrolyzing) [Gelidibacter sp.]